MKTPDERKLPKWAQDRLTLQRRNIDYLREKLAAGPENSDTFADPYGDPARPLGKHVTVRFLVGPNKVGDERNYIDARLDYDHNDQPFVRIASSDTLAVSPQSSNVVNLRVVRL